MCSLERRGDVFILSITGDDDHRLNPTLIDSIRAALARVKSESTRSCALITTAEGKFYSNGYDLAWALSDPTRPRIMSKKLRLLVEDLISLPMPTIAAVNGHAAAAGFILALSHDYILMSEDGGCVQMGEVDINYRVSMWFVRVLRSKIGSPQILRDVILRAEKIGARRGVEWGIVDSAHATAAATVGAALELGADMAGRRWDGKLYAANRRSVFADVLAVMERDEVVGEEEDSVSRDKGPTSKL
ncbi:enoyl-CoA delta isomerase 1, peroxisomal-like [Salvia miltiorrhiza]|uniref:enoyl-CoA delta isomerase 1, peroxisomal-like n=1 Tax=Salvia miltiorrhiza TaxID=226208 RepID=UPI0025AC50DF|nr:enoyl-CoA delta isomerase 1, peroxisomal-like [Salvia miltiorrhiza]XP_057809486.1 enoyl-CoA delta isomerase 1, peroxisomal-like [Salvia miltiorrhiza]